MGSYFPSHEARRKFETHARHLGGKGTCSSRDQAECPWAPLPLQPLHNDLDFCCLKNEWLGLKYEKSYNWFGVRRWLLRNSLFWSRCPVIPVELFSCILYVRLLLFLSWLSLFKGQPDVRLTGGFAHIYNRYFAQWTLAPKVTLKRELPSSRPDAPSATPSIR